jgi:hypothetical protein
MFEITKEKLSRSQIASLHRGTYVLRYIIFIPLFLYSCTLFAQRSYTVQGTVTDENGKPLPAVSIYLLQSKRGTITNSAGKFSLNYEDNAFRAVK